MINQSILNQTQMLEKLPPTPQYVLDQLPAKSDFAWINNPYILLGIVLGIILLIIILIFVLRKSSNFNKNSNLNKNSPDKLFEESFSRGNKYLAEKNFVLAGEEYKKMKNIAEKSNNKEFAKKAMIFYNKYQSVVNT